MLRCTLALAVALAGALTAHAVGPNDILPKYHKYDPTVPTPAKYLGFEIGSRHLHHHQLVGYLKALAKDSARVRIHEYARSHGDRPLVYLTISDPKNLDKLDSIRNDHLRLADPKSSATVNLTNLPVVVWMGYGVHGNEPSASNVSALVAYHLAAGIGPAHEKLLRETVVLLDPCLNPDGFERHAAWANANRGAVANPDPEHREHREPWPNGRTNYYWFDLNRDWLPAVHPESRGRLAIYHQWKPNLVLDFHEMGSNLTYFFQPGHPRRVHPLIPPANLDLTRRLGAFHALALDRLGSLYFTEELFDDFYPGKGSTYPDLHGGVGILFEQAGSRGHLIDTPHGRLTFPFTIRNQFATSLSSLRGAQGLRNALLEYKRTFFRESLDLGSRNGVKGWVFAAPHNGARLAAFLELLHRHDIRAYRLGADLKANGQTFTTADAYVVPAAQPAYRFIQALFETRTRFADRAFYDVSTWTLPLAFDLVHAPLTDLPARGAAYTPAAPPPHAVEFGKDDLAYVLDRRHDGAPRVLHRLLAADVKARVAGRSFGTFTPGAIVVPLGIQGGKRSEIVDVLRQAAKDGVPVQALTSGLPGGVGLGSRSFVPVPRPRVLLVTGEGVSAYEAGEVWHLLDRRVGMPLTLVEGHRLGTVDLTRYSAVVLVSGTYTGIPLATSDRLKRYVEGGGTVVASGTALRRLDARKVATIPFREGTPRAAGRRPYAEAEDEAAEHLISGAIFRADIDATHPLGYGFRGGRLPIFRNNRIVLEPSENAYSTPVVYDREPRWSGYVSDANVQRLAGSASVVVVRAGSGRVIALAEDMNFRGFWRGTERLFVNALFFGPITRVPE